VIKINTKLDLVITGAKDAPRNP